MLALLLAAAAVPAFAPDSPGPDRSTYARARDPYVARDASGRFELAIEPSRPRADRPCRVEVRSDGADQWNAEFPCVWRDAAITASGTCVGWGLETSERAAGEALRARVHLWIVAPDGKPRLATSWECVTKGISLSEDPPPRVLGTMLDGANDRWLVRVHMPWNTVEWRWYRVSTGALYAMHIVRELAPMQGSSIRAIESQVPVAGTTWILTRMATWKWGEGTGGAHRSWTHRFELLDEKGAGWWSIEADRAAADAAIVRWDEARRFDVTFGPAEAVRRFEIVPDVGSPNGAVVRELEALAPIAPKPVRAGG